jgi:putative lipoprotein
MPRLLGLHRHRADTFQLRQTARKGVAADGEPPTGSEEDMADLGQWLVRLVCLVLTAGCAAGSVPSGQTGPAVTGTVSSSDGFVLAPGSEVELTLADVSRMDAPAVVVAKEMLPTNGPYRIPFSLPYNPADIQPSHTYVVSARVTDKAGKVRYLNLNSTPVLTRGALSTHVDVVVDPVQQP